MPILRKTMIGMMMPDKHLLIRELKILLRSAFGGVIQDVILFGSQAAGKAHEDSDYDVLIIVSQDYDWRFRDRISDLVYDLELKYDILIDTFLISTYELAHTLRGTQPVFRNALQYGVYA